MVLHGLSTICCSENLAQQVAELPKTVQILLFAEHPCQSRKTKGLRIKQSNMIGPRELPVFLQLENRITGLEKEEQTLKRLPSTKSRSMKRVDYKTQVFYR